MGFLRHYRIDLIITALVVLFVGFTSSWSSIVPLLILLVMEISFSFDNAIVNAHVLERMSPLWQKLFLTLGMIVAVFGVRFALPIIIVALTAQLGFGDVVALALQHPLDYARHLESAHHLIAMFGGVYLLLIFLNFIFEEQKVTWLKWLEGPLVKIGKLKYVSYIITGILIYIIATRIGQPLENQLLIAGFASMVLNMTITVISKLFETDDVSKQTSHKTGWGALMLFIYLEIQDATFSFDGVSAAFAITSNVILIAFGLGIGALFVRSMTVHLVRSGQLKRLRYLNHGAHWAIGALAVCLLIEVGGTKIPELLVGGSGIIFILAATIHSNIANKRQRT